MSKYTRTLINAGNMLVDLIPYILLGWFMIASGFSPLPVALYLFFVFVLRSIVSHIVTNKIIPWATNKLAK